MREEKLVVLCRVCSHLLLLGLLEILNRLRRNERIQAKDIGQ